MSTIAGRPDKPRQDVFFSTSKCVVVAPGINGKILQTVKTIAEYQRRGNLYIVDMTLASSTDRVRAANIPVNRHANTFKPEHAVMH